MKKIGTLIFAFLFISCTAYYQPNKKTEIPDELWEQIKKSQKRPQFKIKVRQEAIQVAAMAMRLIFDCCDKNE